MLQLILALILLLPAQVWGGSCIGFGQTSGAYDNFNRSDGALGGDWGSGATALSGLAIASNVVSPTTNYGGGSARYTTSSNDTSQATIKGTTPDGEGLQICVRMRDGYDGYCARFAEVGGETYTAWGIRKDGSYLCDGTLSYAKNTDHTLKLVASGTSTTTLTFSVDGATITSSCSDSSTPITSGNPGFRLNGGGAARPQVDDWQGY